MRVHPIATAFTIFVCQDRNASRRLVISQLTYVQAGCGLRPKEAGRRFDPIL